MLVTEVVTELKNSNKFDVRDVKYKAEEDKAKYGKSFEALANKDFNFVKVNDVTTEEYLKMVPQQAKRPLNSRMSKDSLDKAGFKRLPDWKDALSRYLKELED